MDVDPAARATLADVAASAGVSVATASRALAGKGELSGATRARVLTAAHGLGYSRAGTRRGRPRTGTSRLFDLVLGHFHDPYSDEVTVGARSAAAAAGYDLVLMAERDRPDDDWPARIRARGSAGVVLGIVVPTATQLALLREAAIPVVLLDPRAETSPALPSVRTTDRDGGRAAAAHLVAAGASRFVVVVGTPAYRFGRARVEGFEAEIAALRPDASVQRIDADWAGREARRACRDALAPSSDDEVIGVFACSDGLAAGVYGAANDAGRRIGRDLLVVGFDDVRGARRLAPPLTTVRQPIRDMAGDAVRMLVRAAEGELLPTVPHVLPTTLVERDSTRGRRSPLAARADPPLSSTP